MQAATKQGISLPGEAEDKCCWCIPIKIGVLLIGIGIIYSAVVNTLGGLTLLGANFIYGVLFLAAQAPLLLSAFYYIKYFQNDSKETREGLSKACMLAILTTFAVAAVYLVMVVTGASTFGVVMSQIISAGISFVLWTYYAGVCKRYAGQA